METKNTRQWIIIEPGTLLNVRVIEGLPSSVLGYYRRILS